MVCLFGGSKLLHLTCGMYFMDLKTPETTANPKHCTACFFLLSSRWHNTPTAPEWRRVHSLLTSVEGGQDVPKQANGVAAPFQVGPLMDNTW